MLGPVSPLDVEEMLVGHRVGAAPGSSPATAIPIRIVPPAIAGAGAVARGRQTAAVIHDVLAEVERVLNQPELDRFLTYVIPRALAFWGLDEATELSPEEERHVKAQLGEQARQLREERLRQEEQLRRELRAVARRRRAAVRR
jgi:hypothetical protein